MDNKKTNGVSKEEILATLADAVNDKYVRGDRGIIGLEGRSPMHVSDTQPDDSNSEIGDLWYQP